MYILHPLRPPFNLKHNLFTLSVKLFFMISLEKERKEKIAPPPKKKEKSKTKEIVVLKHHEALFTVKFKQGSRLLFLAIWTS